MYVGKLVEVLKGEKSFSNGAQRKALYKLLSYLPIPERTVPSAHLHLITDKEEGFRTAVWFPVNVNGTPIELNLHFVSTTVAALIGLGNRRIKWPRLTKVCKHVCQQIMP